MLAPYSEIARSKESSGSGTASALPSMSGKSTPCSAWRACAVASCSGVTSMPIGRAPRRASHDDTYAVPQPSSMTSRPSSSGSEPIWASGISQTPQAISFSAQWRRPACS
jgi:hypothetical protein